MDDPCNTLEIAQQGAKRGAYALRTEMAQPARERTVERLKNGKLDIVVATDVAARGLDVDRITHVVNYDVPASPDVYVHRIGRTARAGASGIALSFCGPEERGYLRDIEKLIKVSLPKEDRRTPGGHAASHAAAPASPHRSVYAAPRSKSPNSSGRAVAAISW